MQLLAVALPVPKLGSKLPPRTAKLAVPPGSIYMVPAYTNSWWILVGIGLAVWAACPATRPRFCRRSPPVDIRPPPALGPSLIPHWLVGPAPAEAAAGFADRGDLVRVLEMLPTEKIGKQTAMVTARLQALMELGRLDEVRPYLDMTDGRSGTGRGENAMPKKRRQVPEVPAA